MSKLKEAARMVHWVKGQIWPCLARMSDDDLQEVIDSYTRRLWHNTEAGEHFDNDKFEQAWRDYCGLMQLKEDAKALDRAAEEELDRVVVRGVD